MAKLCQLAGMALLGQSDLGPSCSFISSCSVEMVEVLMETLHYALYRTGFCLSHHVLLGRTSKQSQDTVDAFAAFLLNFSSELVVLLMVHPTVI